MIKDYSLLKKKAIKLRKNGLSYNEIRKNIDVSKSTLSFWLKNIVLKPEHRKRLYTKQVQILARGAQSQKERRQREIKEITTRAEKEIRKPLSFEVYRLFGAALYWAEGAKENMFQITNSDPCLILFMVNWLKKVFNFSPKDLTVWLNIHSQQNEIKIKKFWSDLTGIPLKNFGKTHIKPFSTGFKKNNLYYGTLKLYVPKSANFKVRVSGWINAVLKGINPKVKIIESRWKKLRKMPRPINLEMD